MTRTPRHTFDEGMRCIRCRREYARRAETCDGPSGSTNMGALAKRNAYRERQERLKREALEGVIR